MLSELPDGAAPEGIEAAADIAQRLGWSTVWTTDHVLVDPRLSRPADPTPGSPPASASSSARPRTVTMRCAGGPHEIADEVRSFAALGVTHLALYFKTTDPTEVVAQAERFAREVAPLV